MEGYRKLSEIEIHKILYRHSYCLENIARTRLQLFENLRNASEGYEALTFSSKIHSGVATSPTNKTSDDTFFAVLKRSQSEYKTQILLLQADITELEKQENMVDRVLYSFHSLKLICPKAYNIVTELINKESSWDLIVKEKGLSKSTISSAVKCVDKLVTCLYNSTLDKKEISNLNIESIQLLEDLDEATIKSISKF